MLKAAFLKASFYPDLIFCLYSDPTIEAKGDYAGTVKYRIYPTIPEINDSSHCIPNIIFLQCTYKTLPN